ncbi:MAG: Ig-like domain-containing protein [Chloroflexota bacterium]
MTQFDKTVAGSVVVLVALIGLIILMGDRVGVRLSRVSPLGEAHSTDDILIEFTESMNRDTVADTIRFEPEIDGDFSWSGDTVIFRPDEPLLPGDAYTVIVKPGAVSRSGREIQDEFQFSFRVRQPQVAYLAPADSAPQNIWIADPADPASASPATNSPDGVFDFAVSPDGRTIAFSERRSDRPATDLKLLNLDENTIQTLVSCADSDCNSPIWRPDGNMIAYTRVDFNSELPNVGVSPPRIWLVDMTTSPPTTQPLFEDSQILGYGPQWSQDGQTISLFDNSIPGILIYDFEMDSVEAIPSEYGSSGALSPDGNGLVFPELVFDGSVARSRLVLADLQTQALTPLTETPSNVIDDDVAVWHPDGDRLAVGRRYWDDRYTRGLQVYLMNAETGDAEPLIVDERYAHGFMSWDPNGTQIVMQRFQQLTDDGEINNSGRPEIWTYDVQSDELIRISENGFFPRWVP